MPITLDGTNGITLGGSILNSSSTPILQQTGSVLQVVTATTSTAVAVASTTYTDTGLSATITPTSSTSKILVIVNQEYLVNRSNVNAYAGVRLVRGSTTILTPLADATGPYEFGIGAGGATTTELWGRHSISYLDSPSTTSAVTYKTQGRAYVATSSEKITFQATGGTNNGTSTIILMEIAA